MKKFTSLIILVAIIGVLSNSCSRHNDAEDELLNAPKINLDTVAFQHSMKGWEIYSWRNGSSYNFSFIVGTNRTKNYSEVTDNKLIVSGMDSLKLLLSKLPEEEFVYLIGQKWLEASWNTDYYNLALPDSSTVNIIKGYCNKRNLLFMVND
jgi:hypothetical protein